MKRGLHPAKTAQRGYGSDWQKLSKRIRAERPLCEQCKKQGRIRAAEEVHHVVPIARAPHLRLEVSNLLSVCRDCHEQLEQRGSPGAALYGGTPDLWGNRAR